MSVAESEIAEPKVENIEPSSNKISEDLSREIDECVDEVMLEINPEHKKDADDDESGKNIPSDDSDDDDKGDEAIPESDKPSNEPESKLNGEEIPNNEITDELLERAVKSGLSISEAKKYPDANMLSSICDKMDEIRAKTESGNDQSANGDDSDADNAVDDILKTIPDLDPEEIDESIISAVDALKSVIGDMKSEMSKLADENKELKLSGEKTSKQTFFESKVSQLDKNVAKAVKDDPAKKAKLQKEYDILAAGYKAIGDNISNDAIFEKAVTIVLGDVKKQSAELDKKDKLESRNKQFISRPGGTKSKPTTDPFDDTANALDRKYFGKQ